jgi:signal transduction histidine kinase
MATPEARARHAHTAHGMIKRLLSPPEPHRRHLTFLVGLLLLTFVLTVILAVQARGAELARQQQAQGVLVDMSGTAAVQWGRLLEERLGRAAVQSVMPVAGALSLRADHPLAELQSLFRIDMMCAECISEMDAAEFVDIDLRSQRAERTDFRGRRLDPGLGMSIAAQAVSGNLAPLSDDVGLALVFVGDEGDFRFAPALVVHDAGGVPIRVVGYVLQRDVLAQWSATIFRTMPLLPATISKGLPNDSFFSIRAEVSGAVFIDTGHELEFAGADTMRMPPFDGVVLGVGVRQNAETRLLMDGALSSGLPLLLTLLVMISGLIVVSLLLVRREVELVRLRADFISGVSHELRTPLAQIRMFTETLLLNRVRSDVERRRSLEIIDQETRRLAHLVENVLLFSKSEGGRRSPIAPEPTELAAEVRRAVESFGPLSRTRDVSVRMELQDNIIVAVDRGALRQIMVNLVDNAIKYGPSGQRVTVGVALYDELARVWVDDEGPGIPEADRERVFDSFFRLHRDVESRTSGSGIGLAVVRQLARLHEGDARVETAPGGGARIVVEFPDAYLRAASAPDLAAAS